MSPQEKVTAMAASVQAAERAYEAQVATSGPDTPTARRLQRAVAAARARLKRATPAPAQQPSLPGMGSEEGGGPA